VIFVVLKFLTLTNFLILYLLFYIENSTKKTLSAAMFAAKPNLNMTAIHRLASQNNNYYLDIIIYRVRQNKMPPTRKPQFLKKREYFCTKFCLFVHRTTLQSPQVCCFVLYPVFT